MAMKRTSTPELYSKHIRYDMIAEIPEGPNRVLEIGCAEGATGGKLKELGKASFVVGLELDPEAAETASKRLDHVICHDLESAQLDEPFISPNSFDYILMGDILEHLREPWEVLSKIKRYLAPSGRIIISIPNVRHWKVVLPLLFLGRWDYMSHGVLDITHLRFFTLRSATQLVREAGFEIVSCKPMIGRIHEKALNMLLLGFLRGLLAKQWIILAEKADGHGKQ